MRIGNGLRMKYGIPTSQGAGIFVFQGKEIRRFFGPLHVVGNPAEGRRQRVEGETEWQSV
ncbi:MAG: hypothetical protein D4R56_00010 [Deltaproteobacteria bacterium]|nr:MAG: hypothetical protein D4R56_00010 [Deltaproteobacteria bacterium]